MLEDLHAGSNMFALITDESRDCSNKEQMVLIVRYDDQNNQIQECFVGFVECPFGTSGEELARLIESRCTGVGLDLDLLEHKAMMMCQICLASAREQHAY